MNVGILTFHCAHNYGAVLQTYALQEFLKENGHQVDVIDYRPEYLVKQYRTDDPSESLWRRLIRLPLIPLRILRHKRFESFIASNFSLSQYGASRKCIGKHYDAYVLGSDQIWNSNITKGDLTFFGGFDRASNSLLISYAASTEVPHEGASLDFSAEKEHLRKFTSLSVREDALREQIQPLVDTTVCTVVDPILLVDPIVFDRVATREKSVGYVLIYQVNIFANTIPIAKKIQEAKKIRHRIKLVPRITKAELLNSYSAASPERFVGLFKGAEYVVTSTFHGTVFAIICKKQFVCVLSKTRGNYRILSILKNLGLENRMVYSLNDIPEEPIDYDAVLLKLDVLRKASKSFLLSALNSEGKSAIA